MLSLRGSVELAPGAKLLTDDVDQVLKHLVRGGDDLGRSGIGPLGRDQVRELGGQVALATFPNPDGLNSVSGDAYSVSLASGTYNLKTPGEGGAGSIDPSSLEASTVDLSTEFASLITTQRAYSASSKIITTADQMMQDLINIIR